MYKQWIRSWIEFYESLEWLNCVMLSEYLCTTIPRARRTPHKINPGGCPERACVRGGQVKPRKERECMETDGMEGKPSIAGSPISGF